jgi:type I restriction enzyme S subunit
MSDVNFLEKLLDGVEVEWKPLGDLGELVRGNGLQKKDFTETGVPAIHYGQIYTYYGLSTKETKSFVPPDLAKQLKKVNKGDVVITNTSENLEDVGKALVYLGERQAVTGGHASILKPGECLLGKYFAYFTQTEEFSGAKRKYAKGTKVIDVSATDIAKIEIPIPCPENPKKSLEIQAEIVRILDAMTELTTELNNELTVRKKQYKHYRDQLLSFEDGEVEWKTLDEISQKISSGGTPSTSVSEYYDGDIPWLRTQEVDFREIWDTEIKITEAGVKNSSAKWIPANCVIVAMYGATVGKIGINKIPMTTNQACANINLDETVANYRFVFHFLTSQYEYIKSLGAGSQTNINAQIVKNLQVPIPFAKNPKKSLDEQARIVAILDKFDALTNSLTEGLPREIELRQKQYEYYRDLLLSFPKPQEVVV